MGLLDFLGTDDAKLGLGLLAAGGQSATPLDFGQRLQGAMQGLDAEKANKLRLGLLQSQVDENKQQALLRAQQLELAQRKQAWDEQFMGGGLLGGPPSAAPAGAAGPSSMPGSTAAPAPAAGGFNAQAISQKYGVPLEAVVSDFRFNGGKKIAELIAKRAEPNWMNVGGNLVNTNAPGFQGGLQDQASISNDGRATILRANGGDPVVGAPRGALATYGAYQGIANRSNADFTPERVIDPSTGQTVVRPRSQVLQPAASGAPAGYATEPQMRTTAAGDMGADPKALARELQQTRNDLMKPLDEPSRAALKAHEAELLRQQKNLGPAPMAGNVVELSPAEQTANKVAEAKAVGTARADVERETGVLKKEKSAGDMIQAAQRARELLQQGPTQSGAGALLDQAGAFVGLSNKGAKIASQLDIVAGDLINNVPRMEGPQSDGDRAEYAKQAGRVADRTIPAEQRLAAVAEVERLQTKYAKQNGGADGGTEPKAAPKLLDALPAANTSNKGKRIRDTTTGKILISDGMSWKEQ